MLIVLPVAILVAQIALVNNGLLAMIGWGAGLEIVLAILVSKIGHAYGARLQVKLEREWGGLPTHAWLRPNDPTHSEKQKLLWRKSVSEASGLDIAEAINTGDSAEFDKMIADAIMVCRHKMRNEPKAELLNKHNIAFGFARNLAGMKLVALIVCFSCSAASIYGSIWHNFAMTGTAILLLLFVIAVVYYCLADNYVKHCAIRYAEYFFAALTDMMTTK